MCRLAAGENPLFGVSDIEMQREGISFTVDTLGELKRTLPSGELFLLIGMDNYLEFHLWRDPGEILNLATIVVMDRPGYGLDEGGVPAESLIKRLDPRIKRVEVPLVDVSSTQVRRCVQRGRPISGLVPKAVEEYIIAHGLYR
jgi:nicotinate-nucleotide adenylyltransferase